MDMSLPDLPPQPGVKGLAIGVFDGVHRGHQALVQTLCRHGEETAALTFEPHPLAVIVPAQAPPRLTTAAQRAYLLQAAGIGRVVTVRFDAALRSLSAFEFMEALHRLFPDLRRVIVGPSWRFGHSRDGDATLLASYGAEKGFVVEGVPALEFGGAPISSTRIREAVTARDLVEAAVLLGREYAIEGKIVHGAGRGAKLGFPTANIGEITQHLPPPGVYACLAAIPQGLFPAVANYGARPTFNGAGGAVLEAHVIGFSGTLYGQSIAIGTLRFLREEQKFASVEELKAQIAQDVARASLP